VLAAVKELRARVPDSEPAFHRSDGSEITGSAEPGEAQSWNDKLIEVSDWHAAQASNWKAEATTLLAALQEVREWNAELVQTLTRTQEEVQNLVTLLAQKDSWIADLEKARDWHLEK